MPKQNGCGKCSLCGSLGTSKTTCPLNPKAKNPNPKKHQIYFPNISKTHKTYVPNMPNKYPRHVQHMFPLYFKSQSDGQRSLRGKIPLKKTHF